MKRALILGGTGVMGVYLIEIMSKWKEWDVRVTSRKARISLAPNIHYIQGDARDDIFIHTILKDYYDVIVDFMNYGYQEFKDRVQLLLHSTNHYLFLSSCRIFAKSTSPITENSPRLLDVTEDKDFLETQRYALRKARQEDMLCNCGENNWTIVRPYITYGDARLQLGIYEKEQWLYRFLNNKKLVIRKEILDQKTSLTFGKDVSLAISRLMGMHKAYGEAINIVTRETMTWREILEIYQKILKKETGKIFEIYTTTHFPIIEECFEGGYNTLYDRLYDRVFCSDKAYKYCGEIEYLPMRKGLEEALTNFLHTGAHFLPIQWDFEACQDRMFGDISALEAFENEEQRMIYLEYLKSEKYADIDNYLFEKLI